MEKEKRKKIKEMCMIQWRKRKYREIRDADVLSKKIIYWRNLAHLVSGNSSINSICEAAFRIHVRLRASACHKFHASPDSLPLVQG